MKDPQEIAKELAPQIVGEIFDSGDLGYDATIDIDNSRVSHEPWLVVRPENTNDVRIIVIFCVKKGIRLTTKSGGHSAAGYSLNSAGIVIDLVRMVNISYTNDGLGLEVDAGTKWIQVYDFLRNRRDKRIVVGGGCPGVGVAGFLLGGGFSFLSRSFGLGSDNVKSIEMVMADGLIRNVGENSVNKDDKELFWALRGGGGGNFGVATKFKLKLSEVAHPLCVGQIVFPFYRIAEVLSFYDTWSQEIPKELAVYGMMRNFPDPRNEGAPILTLRFTPIFNGSYSDGIRLLQPLLDLNPITAEFHHMTLPEWERFIGSATKVKGRAAYIRSVVIGAQRNLADAADVFKKYMARKPSEDSYIVWTQTGGQIKNFNEGPYPHRNAKFVVEIKSIWEQSEPQLARSNIEWAYNFFEELAPLSDGAYLNYIDPLLDNWQYKYYGEHYSRLETIKGQVDPNGFFDFQQCIGSQFNVPSSPGQRLDLSPLKRTF